MPLVLEIEAKLNDGTRSIFPLSRQTKGWSELNFSLRGLLLSIAVFAIALGWLVSSLSTMNVDFRSNGNDISFGDAEIATTAANRCFELKHESLLITIDGIDVPNAQLGPDVARFNIEIKGKIKRSIPGLQPIWPFTKNELMGMIESELQEKLGSDSKPKFSFSTFPWTISVQQ